MIPLRIEIEGLPEKVYLFSSSFYPIRSWDSESATWPGQAPKKKKMIAGDAAEELTAILGTAKPILPFTGRDPLFGIRQAYEAAARLHAARLARGERPVGRKIGFTKQLL